MDQMEESHEDFNKLQNLSKLKELAKAVEEQD